MVETASVSLGGGGHYVLHDYPLQSVRGPARRRLSGETPPQPFLGYQRMRAVFFYNASPDDVFTVIESQYGLGWALINADPTPTPTFGDQIIGRYTGKYLFVKTAKGVDGPTGGWQPA